MLISKILTLNKLHILENICAAERTVRASRLDYFHLGYPITDPPSVRGSIIVELNLGFLTDNAHFFEYGSPVDIGGVRFGFLRPPDAGIFTERLLCDRHKFMSVVEDLERLPPTVLSRLLRHRNTAEVTDVLARHFDRSIIDFMISSDEPTAWIFEFCLRSGYRIDPSHIECLYYPNTYAHTPLFAKLQQLLGKRCRTFNPRFGIENA